MRKSIYFVAALAAGMLASCSNDEVVHNGQNGGKDAIGFATTVDKNSRGVADISSSNLQGFKVWGYESSSDNALNVVTRFDGTQVSKEGAEWTYSPTQYWTANNFYWFSGYTATNAAAAKFVTAGIDEWPATSETPANKQLFGGTMYFNNGLDAWKVNDNITLAGANGDSDLLYAWWKTDGAVTKGDEPTVDFTFKHILSKVAFKFVNNMPYSTIKVTNLVVRSVAPQGTLNMMATAPAWSVSGTGFDMNYAEDISALQGIAPNGGNATSAFNIFIPAPFTYNIQFTVEVSQNGVKIATYNHNVNISDLTLQMGRAYVLTATLDKTNIDPNGALQPIKFNPTVDDWVDANGNVNVPGK